MSSYMRNITGVSLSLILAFGLVLPIDNAVAKDTNINWNATGLGLDATAPVKVNLPVRKKGFNRMLAYQPGGKKQKPGPNARYWVRKGDEYRANKQYKKALEAYHKAQDLGDNSDELSFRVADTYKDMDRKRDAYWEFDKVSKRSTNPGNRQTACEQQEEMKEYRTKKLRQPYFADLYTHGGFQTIGDAAFIDSKFRWGIKKGDEERWVKWYLFAHAVRDNRSGVVGGFPQEFFDNALRAGAGVKAKLMRNQGLYATAEVGYARDLIDMGRDRNRGDTRAGLEYYMEWGTSYNCRKTKRRPNRFVMVAAAELMYYSRYDDATIFQVDLRPGIRIFETRKQSVDVFLQVGSYNNLSDSNNNYTEIGAGITWMPNRHRDLKITARVSRVNFKAGGDDTNFVLEFQHYILW